jgi:hypothetical protein
VGSSARTNRLHGQADNVNEESPGDRPRNATQYRDTRPFQAKDCKNLTPFGSGALQDAGLPGFLQDRDDQDRTMANDDAIKLKIETR